MGRRCLPRSKLELFFTCIIALLSLLWRSCTVAQITGFLSIDCGSTSTAVYTDSNEIQWTGDGDLISEGRILPVTGGSDTVLSTMRLFEGNESKYCYTLTNSLVDAGAFFLVRVSIWAGKTPPYNPLNSDGLFRFKLLIDSDVWQEVQVGYGTTDYYFYEAYVRAQRSSIDVCLARSEPGGDAPFISGLELRPLPSTLTATKAMNGTDRNLVVIGHADYGALQTGPSFTRYPNDVLDRYWISSTTTATTQLSTNATINVNHIDKPPANILQTSFVSTPTFFTMNFTPVFPTSVFLAEFYFAEIDPSVTAAKQRTFDIILNDPETGPETVNTAGPIDIYALVGSDAAYSQPAAAKSDANGLISFNFSASSTSVKNPFVAAAELFYVFNESFSAGTFASDVSAIGDIKSGMNLSRSSGDPCLPVGYAYPWLNCSQASPPRITEISLSSYGVSGQIPKSINTLTELNQILMNGNDLQGAIPDMSNLTNLQTLDLSNNKLSGSIPTSLASLPKLTVLYLQNNNLSGEIPAALLERKQSSSLTFDFSGNPILCQSNAGVECSAAPAPPSGSPAAAAATSNSKSSLGIIIGVVVGVLVLGIVIALVVFFMCCRKRPPSTSEQPFNKIGTPSHPNLSPNPNAVVGVVPKLSVREFTFQEIKEATNNFSTQLGMGGFGPVYKGQIDDGQYVAIKVASNSSRQGSKEFLNEVDLLSRIHHRNLVRLLGYCNDEMLVLVYEYMSNGSLFDCLHGSHAKASPLSWTTRLRILVDAAQGFDYLHYGCNPRIIHRDVKSSNILLNDNLEGKISDFGISRNSEGDQTGAPPTALMGSMGYMDPEYLSTMKLTEKVDVYSFGVVIFEVVCGRAAVFMDSNEQQIHIAEWARSLTERGMIDEIVDESVQRQYDVSAVWKVVEVAQACVKFWSGERPTMSGVVLELKEAERIQLESAQRNNNFDKPSIEFVGNDYASNLSFTHVNAR